MVKPVSGGQLPKPNKAAFKQSAVSPAIGKPGHNPGSATPIRQRLRATHVSKGVDELELVAAFSGLAVSTTPLNRNESPARMEVDLHQSPIRQSGPSKIDLSQSFDWNPLE